jgi:hypothetical protein
MARTSVKTANQDELGTWNLEVAEMRTNLHSESDAHSPQGNVSAKDRLNIIQRSRTLFGEVSLVRKFHSFTR